MTTALSARIDELSTAGVPFVQATVVRAQEPSSARPGDRAIILADGSIEGFVGGHCAAGSVRTAALDALDSGESLLLRVLPDGDDVFPESPGRQHRGQPVPVRRSPGDLPRAAAAPAVAARRRAPRRPPRPWPTLRRRPRLRGRRGPTAPARRRDRRGRRPATAATSPERSGPRSTPASASSASSAATPAARRCWPSST